MQSSKSRGASAPRWKSFWRRRVHMLKLGQEVSNALAEGRPVVALESTIIAHGFPYPDNYQLALELEALLWEEGVVPATIAFLGGEIKVGLSQEELHHLARAGSI